LLARSRRTDRLGECPLTGVDRKYPIHRQTDAIDSLADHIASAIMQNSADTV
jgi:hypothetical protein